MSTKERIKELCKKNGITVNKLEKELGFGTGYISKLDKSTPNAKNIQKIADRFNVSVDYVIKGKDFEVIIETVNTDIALTNMNERLKAYMLKFAELPKEKQEFIITSIDMLDKKE